MTHYDAEEKALRVSNRNREYGQGPRIDLTLQRPALCLVPDQRYLVTARIKLSKDGMHGLPTSCKNHTGYCPRIVYEVGTSDGKNHGRQRMTPSRVPAQAAGDYGEYFYLKGYFAFETELMGPDIHYLEMYIDGVEPGVDISLDYFDFRLPSESTFQSPDDLCGDFIRNGDAEGNGLSTYPIRDSYEQFEIKEEEDGNKYFHISNRQDYWIRLYNEYDRSCLEKAKGVIYQLSVRLRIHSFGDESYYFQIYGRRDDGSSYYKNIMNCPGHQRKVSLRSVLTC